MTDDTGYEIVDKRSKQEPDSGPQAAEDPVATNGDGDEQPDNVAPSDEPSTATAGGTEDTHGESQEPEADVKSLLLYTISLLGASAWQHLGLLMSPVTQQVHQDLPQARLAIDSMEAIVEKLTPHVDEEIVKQLRQSLRDLKMNYVERSRASR